MSSSIVVGVRVRPFNQREIKYKSAICIDMTGNTTCMFTARSKANGEKPREFAFDYAFWTHDKSDVRDDRPFADQEHVFKALGAPLLDNALEGFNACLFAYGQTGAGKSYSMMGNATEPGLLPRLVGGLFAEAAVRSKAGVAVKVECAFLEIYNDMPQDLLSAKGPVPGGLKVRQDPKKGVFVQGLTQVVVQNADQFEQIMDKALSNRAIAATNMNAVSSRSHAIIQIRLVQVEAGTSCTRTSVMSMVDLAGSERAESTGATGSTMTEAQNINYSLSVLGMCLTRLADIAEAKAGGGGQKLHVPFRDSQLTWLLSDNLGGNSKTSMIAAISPADVNYEETLSTMRFASVTKRVKTVAVVNESANDKLIRELKEELAALQGTLRAMKQSGATPLKPPVGVAAASPIAGLKEDDYAEQDDDELATEVTAADLLSPERNNNNNQQKISTTVNLDEGDDNNDNNAKKKSSEENNNIFTEPEEIDWKVPQFLNLSANNDKNNNNNNNIKNNNTFSAGRLRGEQRTFAQQATQIFEGNNNFKIGTASITISYSGLTGEVTLTVTDLKTPTNEEDNVFVNGEALQRNGSITLKQNDRVICGDNVLRFSHFQSILDAEGKSFRTEPDSPRHAILLESYFRTIITQEQVDEMMGLLSWGLNGDDETTNDSTGRPRCHQSLHSAIAEALSLAEIDQQMIQSQLFSKESVLADEFPQVNKMEDVDFDAKAFEKARKQQEAQLKEKAQQLQNLKAKMNQEAEEAESADIQNRVFAKTSREAALKEAQQIIESAEQEVARMSEAARAEELALQERLDEAAAERILAVELQYHQEVRQMRQFRPAPTDSEDVKIFTRQATILQNDARLNIQRVGEVIQLCDPLVSVTEFAPRTVCLSKRFIFVFKKLYRREPLLFSIYIPGCTTSLTKEPIPGSKNAAAKRFVLDITGAVARSPAPEHQGAQPLIRLAFTDGREARSWKTWLDTNSSPAPPLSIWKRLLESEIADRRNHNSQNQQNNSSAVVAPSEATLQDSALGEKENEPGKAFEIKGWAPDDSATNCARCNKEFGFFTRKHHCRICGEIFCSNCLDAKKVCVPCQTIIATSGKKEEDIIAQNRTNTRPERHRVLLKEPLSNFVEGGKYFAFYSRGRMRAFATRRDLDDFAVSLAAHEEENNGAPASPLSVKDVKPYLIDLFRGRFHEWCAVDISHVWRCSYHPLAVNLKLRDEYFAALSSEGSSSSPSAHQDPNNLADSVFSTQKVEDTRPKAYVSVVCTSVVDRERLFEGIAMMIGRRGYSPIGQNAIGAAGSNEVDCLVIAPPEGHNNQQQQITATTTDSSLVRSCAIKLTNTLKTQLKIRVSQQQQQGSRFQFQQGDFDIIATVSLNSNPPWSQKYLRSAGMVPLCDPIPLSPVNSLFVAADEHLAQHVTPPVTANARGMCILAFGVHESNLMFVASTASDIAEFEEVTEEEHSKLLQDEVALAEAGETGNTPSKTARHHQQEQSQPAAVSTKQNSNNTSINVDDEEDGFQASPNPHKPYNRSRGQSVKSNGAIPPAAIPLNHNNQQNSNNNNQYVSPGRMSTQPQLGSPNIDDLASPNGTNNGNSISANGLHINDQKSILFASALPIEHLVMWPLRGVDPVEQFENIFVIGHTTQLTHFSTKGKSGIQFKHSQQDASSAAAPATPRVTNLATPAGSPQVASLTNTNNGSSSGNNSNNIVVESIGHIEATVQVHQQILTSLRMTSHNNSNTANTSSSSTEDLPAHINIKITRLFDSYEVEVHDNHDAHTTVVVNTPFEKCSNNNNQITDGDKSPSKNVGNTIRLLDRVAEHCAAKNLFVVLRDYGTATVPFHRFMNQAASRKTIIISNCDVMYCGVKTGRVDLAISLF